MAGTMNPTGDWANDPDYLSAPDGTQYKIDLDNALAVARRMCRSFAPHAVSPTPNMTVKLDEGYIFDPATRTLTEKAVQTTGTITAPSTNPRIDRVVIDQLTGTFSVITGTEAASPTPPAITAGNLPVAQIALQTSTTQITNAEITDERALEHLGQSVGSVGVLAINGADDADVTGDGTVVDPVDLDTEIVDLGGDFASDVFTAPFKGLFLIAAYVSLSGILAANHTNIIIDIWTSNRTYGNPGDTGVVDGSYVKSISVIADMDAGDTAKLRCQVAGNNKVVDILGNATNGETWMSIAPFGGF